MNHTNWWENLEDISPDKKNLLEKLLPEKAFLVKGIAGTGKTFAGLLCGKRLLEFYKPWQKVLYLTYSKFAKRQIADCSRKLFEKKILSKEDIKCMEIQNYHSLWWDLIRHYYCFLGIGKEPRICTKNELNKFSADSLNNLGKRGVIPDSYLRQDGEVNKKKRGSLLKSISGLSLICSEWNPKEFGKEGNIFEEKTFLKWVKEITHTWNSKGNFYHTETVWWAYKLLIRHPNALSVFKAKYPILIIDEFQDTDIAQWSIVKLISPNTVMALADEAQTIHKWRGADSERLKQFIAYCKGKGECGEIETITLTQTHRSSKLMSLNENIQWEIVKADDVHKDQKESVLKRKTFATCKSQTLKSESKKAISILCRTNNQADEFTDYFRKRNDFQNGKFLPPLNCIRLGTDNSPFEKAQEVVIKLLDVVITNPLTFPNYLANDFLLKLLPFKKYSNEFPLATNKSKKVNLKRWNDAGSIEKIFSDDFGEGLINCRNYVLAQEEPYKCKCDKTTVNCIAYIGRSIIKHGRKAWQEMTFEEKRKKIDSLILQYENAMAGYTERISIMTAHQSKGREFDVVIIPWFSNVAWDKKNPSTWDTTADEETANLFHTACTRAKEKVIVICPEGYEATWPVEKP